MRKSAFAAAMVGIVMMGLAWLGIARADSPAPAVADPTGHWQWKFEPPNGDSIDMALDLKLDGDKLTGTFIDGFDQQKIAIKNAKVKDGNVTFTVERTFNDTPISVDYDGKLTGDTIKGKLNVKFGDGDLMPIDWEAKRGNPTTQPATQP